MDACKAGKHSQRKRHEEALGEQGTQGLAGCFDGCKELGNQGTAVSTGPRIDSMDHTQIVGNRSDRLANHGGWRSTGKVCDRSDNTQGRRGCFVSRNMRFTARLQPNQYVSESGILLLTHDNLVKSND
jgi:hypothetical protein